MTNKPNTKGLKHLYNIEENKRKHNNKLINSLSKFNKVDIRDIKPLRVANMVKFGVIERG